MKIRRLASLPFLLLVGACAGGPDAVDPAAEGVPATATVAGAADLSPYDAEADAILARMTLEEKVGQMTQADLSYLEDDRDVATYFLGSVLSGGGSDPAAGNSPAAWRELYERLQRVAQSTRLGIPILYGVDAVHGHSNVVGATVFPHNIGLGATRDAALVEEVYRATALEVRATGIQWNFAPCVAVARDIRWGRTYEAFSEDPGLVAELGAAAVRGLQGDGPGDPRGVLACAKHYVGDGGTTYGTGAPKEGIPDSVFAESGPSDFDDATRWPLDRGDTQMDEARLRAVHMPGYLTALEEGVLTIMPSFSSWNGERLSGHRYLLTDVLKGELGFQGFLVSDWAAIDDLPGDYYADVVESVNAGMDMVMVPDRYREFFTNLKQAAESGDVPMARIDDAVRRILRVKLAMGLFDPERSQMADPALADVVGSAEHRALGRRAVRQSLVLLRNEGGALPLRRDLARIHVVGKNADDIGNQSGGWTVQWQGASGEITEGTTILEAIRAAAGDTTEVTFAADGSDIDSSGGEGADVVVAVIGETPYAEMMGDRTDLALDAADTAAVERAAASGATVVTVLVSGRPMILGDTLERSDAFVAAWLPGTEGEGVADVLFGDHAPTGKLPFTWPRSMDQVPIHVGDEDQDPLFAYGFGLTY